MKRIALVTFAASPGQGSEPGVGWEFIKASMTLASSSNCDVTVFYDARDTANVQESKEWVAMSTATNFRMRPVRFPKFLVSFFDGRRTRFAYLVWRALAKREIVWFQRRNGRFDVAHQVTFATAYLPPVVRHTKGLRVVWGPVMIPTNADFKCKSSIRSKLRWLQVFALQKISLFFIQDASLVLFTNQVSANFLLPQVCEVEPNVFIDSVDVLPWTGRASRQIAVVGNLISRKRPWKALDLLNHEGFERSAVIFVGDGPLMVSLRERAQELGLERRVRFTGQIAMADARGIISRSEFLFHPAEREGASWVVGEATASGTPVLVATDSGAASTMTLAQKYGMTVDFKEDWLEAALVWVTRLPNERIEPSSRWDSTRLATLLSRWWNL